MVSRCSTMLDFQTATPASIQARILDHERRHQGSCLRRKSAAVAAAAVVAATAPAAAATARAVAMAAMVMVMVQSAERAVAWAVGCPIRDTPSSRRSRRRRWS